MEIGDIVVCIDASEGWIDGVMDLEIDQTYYIVDMKKSNNGRMNIKVSGINGYWDLSRFRKVPPKEELINEMLANIGIDRIKKEREKDPITAPETEKIFTTDEPF